MNTHSFDFDTGATSTSAACAFTYAATAGLVARLSGPLVAAGQNHFDGFTRAVEKIDGHAASEKTGCRSRVVRAGVA
jgi:hypothetical protein